MPGCSPLNVVAILIPLVGVGIVLYWNFLHDTVVLLGHFRPVQSLNNENCHAVQGLVGCEDMYLDRKSGLLYLACVPPTIRKHWLPALQHLNATAVPALSPGYFATYDTRTGIVTRLTIEGGPEEGYQLHGFDLFIEEPEQKDKKNKKKDEGEDEEPRKATLFAINHRVPRGGFLSAKTTGADSVVEVFETEIGSGVLRHQQTIKDSWLYTPNNLVATGHSTFYASNDHWQKTGLTRKIPTDVLFGWPVSSIAYCDLTTKLGSYCSGAVKETLYPNGLARGPGKTIYAAGSILAAISQFDIVLDDDLKLMRTIPIKRILDNLHVEPDGTIYVAAIPQLDPFAKVTSTAMGKAPSEVWRVRNATGSGSYFAGEQEVELIFADDGTKASTITSAIPFEGKLYLTGISSEHLAVCEIPGLGDYERPPSVAEVLS